jgi:hypothetical protein
MPKMAVRSAIYSTPKFSKILYTEIQTAHLNILRSVICNTPSSLQKTRPAKVCKMYCLILTYPVPSGSFKAGNAPTMDDAISSLMSAEGLKSKNKNISAKEIG